MDELVIDDKKYVSSKQAAKLTGYAKDYVGQLCREGRVQAQLVGRAWYVLESAIQDHRFGTGADTPDKPKQMKREEGREAVFTPVWEAPRYVPSVNEVLPNIKPKQTLEVTENIGVVESTESLSEWLTVEDADVPTAETLPEVLDTADPSLVEEELPVRHASESGHDTENAPVPQRRSRRGARLAARAVRLIGTLLILASLSLVALNSGYLDKYTVSFSQAWVFEGISVYNRPFK